MKWKELPREKSSSEKKISGMGTQSLSFSLFLLSEFTVLASWLFRLCESGSLSLMINVYTRTIDQTNELLQNSCNILLKALIKSAGLRMRAELVETLLHNAICKIQLKK